MDWLHCNICYKRPKADIRYYFTSCGHIFCINCCKKVAANALQDGAPTSLRSCCLCAKPARTLEVNRNLALEHQCLFRETKEFHADYTAKLTKMLEFQSYHRTRYMRAMKERVTEAEKKLKAANNENTQIKAELQQCRQSISRDAQLLQSLKSQNTNAMEEIVKLKTEISNLRKRHLQNELTPKRSLIRADAFDRRILNLRGDTPTHALPLGNIPMSTPVNDEIQIQMQPQSAALEGSPSVAAGGGYMNTPTLLGIHQKRDNLTRHYF